MSKQLESPLADQGSNRGLLGEVTQVIISDEIVLEEALYSPETFGVESIQFMSKFIRVQVSELMSRTRVLFGAMCDVAVTPDCVKVILSTIEICFMY